MVLCFGINRFHLCALLTWQFAIFFASQMLFPTLSIRSNQNNFRYSPTSCRDGAVPIIPTPPVPSHRLRLLLLLTFRATARSSRSVRLISCGSSSRSLSAPPHSNFGWICGSDAYKRALYSQAQFGGVLLGTFSSGALSDAFGRRPIAMFVLSFGISAVVASAFATSWQFLLVTRFLVGLSIGGTLVVALRAFFNWGIARLALTLLCLLFPHWQSASIACAIAALPALLFVVFVFPESPMWLHSKNRLEQMRDSERRIARIAGVPFTETVHRAVPEKERSFCDLAHEKALFKRVAVLWVMWFTAAICGYSIDLNSANISGDLYLNQSLLSILIAFSKVLLVLFDTYFPRFSRRNLHQWSQLVVILCFMFLSWLVLAEHQGVGILLVNLLGTVFIEFTWDACYLCSVESVPTPLRASSVGSCSLVVRLLPNCSLNPQNIPNLGSCWRFVRSPARLPQLVVAGECVFGGIDLDSVRLAQRADETDDEDARRGGGKAEEGTNRTEEVEALVFRTQTKKEPRGDDDDQRGGRTMPHVLSTKAD
uniref:MFS domain-containing protein n=1 Tax=Globodera pallida TaxID=36090 RepID=A0A183C3P9_GLOPA